MTIEPFLQVTIIASLLMLFFFLFVHPVCVLLSITRSELSTQKKSFYFLAVVLTWSIGNLIYAFGGPTSSFFKRTTAFALAVSIASASYIWMNVDALPPEIKEQWEKSTQNHPLTVR